MKSIVKLRLRLIVEGVGEEAALLAKSKSPPLAVDFRVINSIISLCHSVILTQCLVLVVSLKDKPPQEWAKAFKEAKQWAQEVSIIHG